MAVVLLPGGSDMAGKPVKVILPLAGEVLFQFCLLYTSRPAGKEIHRKADKPGKAETNKLALRQVEGQLGLNFG